MVSPGLDCQAGGLWIYLRSRCHQGRPLASKQVLILALLQELEFCLASDPRLAWYVDMPSCLNSSLTSWAEVGTSAFSCEFFWSGVLAQRLELAYRQHLSCLDIPGVPWVPGTAPQDKLQPQKACLGALHASLVPLHCLYLVWGHFLPFWGGVQGFSLAPSRWEFGEEGLTAVRHPEVPEGRVTAVSMMPCMNMVECKVTSLLEL